MIFSDPRPMIQGEREFVAKSWMESFKTSAMARLISNGGAAGQDLPHIVSPEFMQDWGDLVSKLLDRATTLITLDDKDLIAGFVCYEPWNSGMCVHYVYSRLMYRKQGVARLLVGNVPLDEGFTYYTHRSRGITKVPDGWQFTIRPLLSLLQEAA